MAYTVRKLLESEQFPKMKLLCGEKGLDLEVKGIRIIEIEDMERYLTGGEILITSLQVYLSCSDREVEQHFEDLVKSEISGFIVKKRKEYDPTGRRLSLLEKHCKKYEIPLVEIPGDFYYWEIIRYVIMQVFDKDTARLKYFKITHDSFNSFILKNNGSSNTASDIIKFLSIMIENPVVLYYGNLNCMVSTNSDNSKLILSDEIQPYKPNIITKFQYMKQMKGSCVQYVVKFAILSEVEVYITITEENRELTELDYMAIENAIINLQYGFLSEFAQDEVKKKYQRDLIHNILNGLLSSKEMTEAAAQLGMKESDTYRVVDFHTIKKNVQSKYTKEQLHEVGVIEGELKHLLPDALIYRNMDQIVMIQQVDSNQTELEYQKEMEEVEDVIQRSILYRKKDTDFQIGIGKLTTVLNHNQIVESGYQDDISFYTKQVYLQLQKNYPEYGITDEEIASVAHLAPIHDIGKIKVPIEILNKNGKLTDEEMNVVKQHPLVGAAMTRRFPEGVITEKLNQYSYEICRHHHERYDGSGYPDGLKGNAIPMCAQVVGIVDAYDALINDRPYKRKYEPEEAIRMISNGECGAFSKKLIQCLTAAAKQPEWLKVTKSQA